MNAEERYETINPAPKTPWQWVGTLVIAAFMVWATFALQGCGTVSAQTQYPKVEQQAVFTYWEMKTVLEEVFEEEYIMGYVQGANVRKYATYRPEDYVTVHEQMVWKTDPGWSNAYLCVQYAIKFRGDMQLAAAHSGHTEAPAAIAWFGVRQIHDWGGVAGDTDPRHALNVYVAGARGEMSVWVLEPQNGQRVKVAEEVDGEWELYRDRYPNLPYVEFVRLEL